MVWMIWTLSISGMYSTKILTLPKLGSARLHAVKPIYWHRGCDEGQCSVYCKAPDKESRTANALKGWAPRGFQQRILIGKVMEGSLRVCDHLCTILWLADGEVIGWYHYPYHQRLTLSIFRLWSGGSWSWSGDLVVILASVKQLRKYASDTII